MDKVRKPTISVCYTPSSEPYSIYLLYDNLQVESILIIANAGNTLCSYHEEKF
jgi:hypothetical protein